MKKLLALLIVVALISPGYTGTVTLSNTFTAGTIIDPSQVNTNFTDITGEVNGNIENVNVSGTAAITASKLNLSTIAEDVLISVAGTPLTLNNSSATGPIFQVLDNGTTVFFVDDGGDVVIGTNTVGGGTLVIEANAVQESQPLALRNTDTTDGNTSRINFRSMGDDGTEQTFSIVESSYTSHTAGSETSDINWFTSDSGAIVLQMTLKNTGRLGLGTGSPDNVLTVSGDADITGTLGVGVTTPDGSLHVLTTSAGSVTASTAGDDLVIENSVSGGITILSSQTVTGSLLFGDPDDNDVGRIQYDHSANVMNFLSAATPAMRLDDSGFVHIQPSGTADVELEVSDGSSTGGGDIHRAASGTHSSKSIKSDIRPMTGQEKQQRFNDVKALDHIEFRYLVRDSSGTLKRNPNGKLRKGLILEDAPDSIKDGEAIMIDDRVLNLEIAIQMMIKDNNELKDRIETLEAFHP